MDPVMTWQNAMQVVVARTRHERYRWLCSDENPDVASRDGYRRLVIKMAGGDPASVPPVHVQAVNLWRSIKAFAKSGGKLAPKSVRAARQATCNVCPHWTGFRCGRCGCTGLKLYSAAAECPDKPARWGAYKGEAS
jgi:hypothetical protein